MATIAMTSLTLSSCDDDLSGEQEIPNAPYVLSLGVTSSGNTSYYVVSTDNLMEGTINAVGKVSSKMAITIISKAAIPSSASEDWE